ncbi:MAG: tRNA (N(6)-L-threonylcarbamoyladenosine(37)-C(2))-methylthiotransferase MtaB [Chitinivibrionia bacterium]|nr:tRNA (N(6)-L-threonylcarbamoyladenosine(37)-C(2))-methylthiotransferase MtaB [Chitinivibrionia bacterium]
MHYTVAFETLGCRLNQAETAHLHRSFMEKGYAVAENSAQADLCVVNTCALTSQAASKCRRRIRSILRANPDACIAAVGCYAQTDTEVLRAIEGIDYIIGTADKMDLASIIPEPAKLPEAVVVTRRMPRDGFSVAGTGYYPSHTRANIKIQEGCDFVCSFCIIPTSRGPARSRDFDDILRETRALVAEGHREIILTGINLGTYRDRDKGLVELIEAQSRIEGLERIRMSSIEPTTIDERLFDYMSGGAPEEYDVGRGGPKLCPYLHISLQSGDDGVLEAMRRRYTAREFEDFVELFLGRVPGAGMGTDVMVGFPGEDDEAFERTYELVSRIPFTHIHVFSFSARKGTAAYLMKNKVPAAAIAERSERMHELGEEKKEAYYSRCIGTNVRVLFEERETSGYFVGFTDNYVKVGAKHAGGLSNRFGDVAIRECVRSGPANALLAAGDLIKIERAAGDLVDIERGAESAAEAINKP